MKSRLSQALLAHPRLFDAAKRISRVLGDRSPQYDFLRGFASENPRCRFLQIGANDGLRNDPLREFVIRHRWTGILVEPVPYVFERLQANYRHRPGLYFENAAVSNAPGSMPFYAVSESGLADDHDPASQLGSFERGHILDHFGRPEDVVELSVPVVTVEGLLAKHGFDDIDLLQIDAEGHELNILASIDFTRVRPKAIIFESRHLSERGSAVFQSLALAGYDSRNVGEDAIAERRASV